ncbi:MAG: Nucleoside-triphosphatase rdgB [Gemmatimonadetes bacterium]|nr:Nucleoside-triphosphatase rdgB [Gemmatimonadota bacterium]
MRLLAATRSKGKQAEFRRLLEAAGHEVIFPDDAGIPLREELEDGLEMESTFEGNARRKAEYFAKLSGLPTIADDSGLEVISLGGAPGVRSRRWSGVDGPEAVVSAANNAELLRRLAGAPATKRTARYRCVIVYLSAPTAAPAVFEGTCPGRILEEADGTGGFGYDPLFLSAEIGKSFGSATPEEKDAISHRGKALQSLIQSLT